MATCEELAATIAGLQAALIVDDAAIQAAQNVRTAHQMELWYAQYNFFLQGCGGGSGSGDGSGSGSGSGSGIADGSGSGSGSGFGMSADRKAMFPEFPARTSSELVLIMTNPKLFDIHKQAEARARMIGLVG